MRETIAKLFQEVYTELLGEDPPTPTNEMVLLESGVDSLGFAILVARLEEELGFDPFSDSEDAYYPKTFGDFVTFYEKHS